MLRGPAKIAGRRCYCVLDRARIEGTKLTSEVEAKTVTPLPTVSGKTLLVALESGKTSINVKGKQLTVSLNAYITKGRLEVGPLRS